MVRRYFKDKILHPVTDIKYLNTQYDIIEHVLNNYEDFMKLRKMFVSIKDIEHLYRKIIFNKVTPFDLSQFMENLELPKKTLKDLKVKFSFFKDFGFLALPYNTKLSACSIPDLPVPFTA